MKPAVSALTVTQRYENELVQHGYQPDAAQQQAVARLQQSYDEWLAFKQQRQAVFRRLLRPVLRPPAPPRGVYLWGGVGRGKSFLMDTYYHAVPLARKTRLHFHEFMRGVHRQLDDVKGVADPLVEVARRIAKKYRLICFDEFHVSDVADAMILYRLLDALMARGVAFVMTSNYPPAGLYPDGLHRDRILPAIALIEKNLDIVNVDAGIDYRRRALEQLSVYHQPLNAQACQALEHAFSQLAGGPEQPDPILHIEGRLLRPIKLAGNTVWFDFATLCAGPRSQNDYLELARQFETVIVSDVPRMSARQASEARRFTWLIDVFYDSKVKLILSADGPPEALYTEGPMANEFHRTVSRMLEMQSREYMEAKRRVAAVL